MNTEVLYFYTDEQNSAVAKCESVISPFANQISEGSVTYSKVNSDHLKLFNALKKANSYSNIVFLCCDLPIAVDVICKMLREDPESNDEFSAFVSRNGRNDLADTVFPKASTVFFDRNSFYAGFIKKVLGKFIIYLPLEPNSAYNILSAHIIPYFSKAFKKSFSNIRIRSFELNYQKIYKELDFIKRKHNVNIEIQNNVGISDIVLSCNNQSFENADSICASAIADIRSILGNNIFEIGIKSIAETCVDSLKRNNFTIATAESCTGGMLSEAITSVEGSSRVLEMGICAYSNKIKNELVGVSNEILDTYGAISKYTAAALAKGIKDKSGATLGVGITGVAGPASSEGKPVGTVYISLYDGTRFWIRGLSLGQDKTRDFIRQYAVNTALDLVRRYVSFFPEIMDGACDFSDLSVIYNQPSSKISYLKQSKSKLASESVEVKAETAIISYSEDDYVISSSAEDNIFEEESDYIYADHDFILSENKERAPENKVTENGDDSVSLESFIKEDDSTKKAKKKRGILGFFKNGSKAQRVTKIIFSVIAVLLVVACVFTSSYFIKIYRDLSQIDDARDIFAKHSTAEAFNKLSAKNSDFKGWLTIDSTDINNPLYQTVNNTYYVNHNMNKQKSRYGALFIDYRNTLTGENTSENLVIYGQNMDDGTMFGTLSKYQDISFITKHSSISLYLNSNKQNYTVYAVLIMNAVKEDDDGYLFEFTKSTFDNETSFNNWISELNQRNLYNTNIEAVYGDEFLTLVTTNNAFDNARLVIVAKKNTDNNVSPVYSVNKTPRYPKAWYDERNLKPNYTSSDSSLPEETSSNESSEESSSSSEESSSSSSNSTPTQAPTSGSSSVSGESGSSSNSSPAESDNSGSFEAPEDDTDNTTNTPTE